MQRERKGERDRGGERAFLVILWMWPKILKSISECKIILQFFAAAQFKDSLIQLWFVEKNEPFGCWNENDFLAAKNWEKGKAAEHKYWRNITAGWLNFSYSVV